MTERILPQYTALVREAFDTSAMSDGFNLYRDDPLSVRVWRELRRGERAAQLELIDFVARHHGELQQEIAEAGELA